jgi:ribonuclease HII
MAIICGIDEAGRGPLAGPVTAAAVILPAEYPSGLLADSKKMTARQRDVSREWILENAVCYAVGWVSPETIDKLNIHYASLLAMERAFHLLSILPELVLVDGKFTPELPIECRAIIKGDSLIPEIQAASILAKTERDKRMVEYSNQYPQYRFEKHKGYPTKEHRSLIREFGYSPIHRKSFTFCDP